MYGYTELPNGDGVAGVSLGAGGEGVYGVGTRNGMHGLSYSASDSGVWGENRGGGYGVSGSTNSNDLFLSVAGVWGVSSGYASGVRDTSANGVGVLGEGQPGVLGFSRTGGNAGEFSGGDVVINNGNFWVFGGTKSAVVETASFGKRRLYAVESPENWFEDFGRARLIHGRAVIKIDPVFGETVNTESDYHVFVTPNGDCEGLYITSQIATSFEIRESKRGKSNIAFDYWIVAKRRAYENVRLDAFTEGKAAPVVADAVDLKADTVQQRQPEVNNSVPPMARRQGVQPV